MSVFWSNGLMFLVLVNVNRCEGSVGVSAFFVVFGLVFLICLCVSNLYSVLVYIMSCVCLLSLGFVFVLRYNDVKVSVSGLNVILFESVASSAFFKRFFDWSLWSNVWYGMEVIGYVLFKFNVFGLWGGIFCVFLVLRMSLVWFFSVVVFSAMCVCMSFGDVMEVLFNFFVVFSLFIWCLCLFDVNVLSCFVLIFVWIVGLLIFVKLFLECFV